MQKTFIFVMFTCSVCDMTDTIWVHVEAIFMDLPKVEFSFVTFNSFQHTFSLSCNVDAFYFILSFLGVQIGSMAVLWEIPGPIWWSAHWGYCWFEHGQRNFLSRWLGDRSCKLNCKCKQSHSLIWRFILLVGKNCTYLVVSLEY